MIDQTATGKRVQTRMVSLPFKRVKSTTSNLEIMRSVSWKKRGMGILSVA